MPPGPVSCIGGTKYPHCIVLYCNVNCTCNNLFHHCMSQESSNVCIVIVYPIKILRDEVVVSVLLDIRT